MPVKVTVVDQASYRLREATDAVWARVARAVERAGIELAGDVAQNQLTGLALHVKTGKLRRSIISKFTLSKAGAVATVGTNVVYGRFWELGYHGKVSVKAHTRRLRRVGPRGGRGRLGSGGVSSVRSFERQVDQNARPFLRPELEAYRRRFDSLIWKAVAGGH